MAYIEMKHTVTNGIKQVMWKSSQTMISRSRSEKGELDDPTRLLLGQEIQLFSIFLVVWIPMMKERSSAMGKTSPIIMRNNETALSQRRCRIRLSIL